MKKNLDYYGLFKPNSNWHKFILTMKISTFLLFCCLADIFAAPTYSQATKISLNLKDATIEDVLNKIEDVSEFYFLFNQKLVDVTRKVNIEADKEPIVDILNDIFKDDIKFIVYDRQIILTPSYVTSFSSAMQQLTITGTVTDASTGEALPGVNIVVVGTTIGTISDASGRYTLDVPNPSARLQFSFIGYVSQEVAQGGLKAINIAMTSNVAQLNDVVIVAYGTQQKKSVTGSISQLNAKEIRDLPVANIGQKLQGKFVGVQINQNNGTPGAEMTFRIRGAASINAGNSPLIVVDGFPTLSGLATINPDEIESITVLKDASASSLYGSRASNGVILITTKQAKRGQTNIEFSTYVGIESVSDRGKPDLMNAQEFAQYKKEWYEDAAIYEGYTGGVPAVYQNPSQYATNTGTNWFDLLLRKAVTKDYNLSVSSGGEKLKSVVVLNYNKQEGVVLNSYSERFSGRSNNIFEASDKLTFGLNLSGTYRNNQAVSGLTNGRNIIENAYLMDPSLNYKNADGTYPLSFLQPGMFANPNYYLVLTQRKNPVKESTILANAFGEYKIIKGLVYKLSMNVNSNNTITRVWIPSTAQGGLGGGAPQPATGSYGTSYFLSWLAENTLTYQKTINGKHNIDALLGYSFQDSYAESSRIDGTQFPDDNIEWVNVATTRIGTVSASDYSLLSFLARLNYNYKGTYLLSVAFRRDGSSRFGANAKFGNFPSVSLGWVVSNEDFMQNIDKISSLKIRASYGKVGNYNIGNYTSIASVSTSNYAFNNLTTPGKTLSGIGNADLTWETTSSYDVGLDLDLFKGRLSFTYDYYWKKTDGLLYAIDIPIQSGFSSIQSNIGRFDFWGHEFSILSRNFTGKFNWNTNFNISFDRNLVKKLGTNDTPIGATQLYWDDNRTAVGHPIGMFYGYINTGVYMTQEEFDTQPHGTTSMVGTARFKDISGPDGVPDGKIDATDRTFIGNPNPDFIYGITNDFTYKNFDLSFLIAGTVGNDIADDAYQSTENLDGVFNVRKGVVNRWRTLENPGTGEYPRTRAGTTADYRNFTTRQVFKGTYLSVKNITIGYTLPLPSNQYLKSARVYFSTQNPFIFTKYPGMNPEVGMSGLNGLNQGRDFTSYPIAQIFTGGLKINF